MRAIILYGPNRFGPMEVPTPEIQEGEILIRMERAAICGTDIRILEGTKTKDVRYPSIIGHEFAGVIEQVGSGVETHQRGDRVAVCPIIPCGTCHCCLSGRENACTRRQSIGYNYDGGFAEYVRIPAQAVTNGNVIHLPDHVSFEEGALIEPLACCINGQKNAGLSFMDSVLILGAGPIGLMHLQLAKQAGAGPVLVSDPLSNRRDTALSLGADRVIDPSKENLRKVVTEYTRGLGMDVVIMAVGIPGMVNECLQLCRKGGSLNLFAGFPDKGMAEISANIIHYGELRVTGATSKRRKEYFEAARLVEEGKINLAALATHTFSIDHFEQAYQTCKSGVGLKIIIRP